MSARPSALGSKDQRQCDEGVPYRSEGRWRRRGSEWREDQSEAAQEDRIPDYGDDEYDDVEYYDNAEVMVMLGQVKKKQRKKWRRRRRAKRIFLCHSCPSPLRGSFVPPGEGGWPMSPWDELE